MTRAERVSLRRWRSVLLVCVLTTLTGIVLIIWTRIDHETSRGDQLAAEADLRGTAVSTLAGDVRALRAQLQAGGKTPVAPDPAKAVEHLPDRTAVPVPIPGPPGPKGDPGSPGPTGSPGTPGPTGSPGSPGSLGSPGAAGQDGVNGKDGAPGAAGADGKDGAQGPQGDTGPTGATGPQGPAGPDCPTGYSLQPAVDDPYALVCRQDGAPSPSPTSSPSQPALAPDRRRI